MSTIDDQNNTSEKTLSEHVTSALTDYFKELDGQHTTNLYDMVLQEVERPLLESVLGHTKNNQSITARILGLSRGTLRKKMQKYGLLD